MNCPVKDCWSEDSAMNHLCRKHFPSGMRGTYAYNRVWRITRTMEGFLALEEDDIRTLRGVGDGYAKAIADVQVSLGGRV